jgi:predicted GIY-YIG superfamily endonuclease
MAIMQPIGKRGSEVLADMTWHLYVVRTVKGSLYAGIATNVKRRYQEHATGSPKAARFGSNSKRIAE